MVRQLFRPAGVHTRERASDRRSADTARGRNVAVRLLAILSNTRLSLAEMRDQLPSVVNTPELRFPCSESRKFEVVREVRERLRKAAAEMTDIDGVRVRTSDGWWLLRASNTQAVLVARAESATAEGLARLKLELAAELAASGVQLPDA